MSTPDLAFVEDLAREAGTLLSTMAGKLAGFEKKGARDLVTEADKAAEALIVQRLRERFPGHAVLAEEGHAEVRSDGPLWIIDPVDGTTNFVYGLPHYAVSIAYCEGGRPLLGCVHNPALDECHTAARGEGARKNGQRIEVRQESALSEALLATGLAYSREEKADSNLQHITDFALKARCLRRLGSAALDLVYVAEGRLDGYWELHLSPWDVAAGGLICAEAGGLVTDFGGGEDWLFTGEVVAANPALNAAMRATLAAADPARLAGPRYRAQ